MGPLEELFPEEEEATVRKPLDPCHVCDCCNLRPCICAGWDDPYS